MSGNRVSIAELKDFATAVLRAKGVDVAQLEATVANMMWCELAGRSNFGIERLPIHGKRIDKGLIKCPCSPVFENLTGSLARLDGDAGIGHYVAEFAMQKAIAMARATGIGVVGVRNSNFFNAGAYYVKLAADQGMIALAMSNSFPKVAPYGGIKAVLGTNPFAFGAPRQNGEHLLIDMATSGLAGSTVREHIAKNLPLAPGLAVDAQGQPITDPKKVNEGALLPFGGAKGFGLSLIVEILAGILTGAGVGEGVASMYNDFTRAANMGHFMMALDVSRWMPMEQYHGRYDNLVAALKGSGPDVLLPGEMRWKAYRENERRGVVIDPTIARPVGAYARELGITPPFAVD